MTRPHFAPELIANLLLCVTDHLYARADGPFHLQLNARLAREGGANIAIASEGISRQVEGEKEARLRAAVSLFTSSEHYRWVTELRLWALGSLDLRQGKVGQEAYANWGLIFWIG